MNSQELNNILTILKRCSELKSADCGNTCPFYSADECIKQNFFGKEVKEKYHETNYGVFVVNNFGERNEYELSSCSQVFFSFAFGLDKENARKVYATFRKKVRGAFDCEEQGFPCAFLPQMAKMVLDLYNQKNYQFEVE